MKSQELQEATEQRSPFEAADATPGDVQIQPCGFLLELSPDWLVARASENVHKFLGEYHVRLIGEPLGNFTLAQPLHDLRNLLSRQGVGNGTARAYRVRLVDEPRHFDIAFQMRDGRILLEGVPAADEGYGTALGSVGRLIERFDGGDRQALLDTTARRVRALTGFDRVTVSMTDGAEEQSAESSRGNFAPKAKPRHIEDLPAIIADTGAAPVSLFPRLPDDRAPDGALLRSPDARQLAGLHAQGILSTIDVPIIVDGKAIGLFECEDRRACPPNLEMHAAVELFAKVFALQLGGRNG